jgi:GcrA cell cycle regulator
MVAAWSQFKWTEERVQRLRELWPSHSAWQIAKLIGNPSRNSIIGKAHRLGLACPPANDKAHAMRQSQAHRKPYKRSAEGERRRHTAQVRSIAGIEPGLHELSNAMKRPFKPKPDPEMVAALRAIPDTPKVKSILDLEPHHCRWPCGEPTEGFCGDHKLAGSPYCERHKQRATDAYVRPPTTYVDRKTTRYQYSRASAHRSPKVMA